MHKLLLLCLAVLFCGVQCKSNVKTIEGQEVMDIGAPLKDLPQGIELEPSAEKDDDDEDNPIPATKTTIPGATKAKKLADRRKLKDVDRIDGVQQELDEAKIEQEMAEIYKDSNDYKDSAEAVKTQKGGVAASKEPLRGKLRDQFKFQPDSNDPQDIARFRTSVDDISCAVTKKLQGTNQKENKLVEQKKDSASQWTVSLSLLGLTTALCYYV